MEKQKIVATQIRIGEDLYEYAKTEADRLALSLNAALNVIIDDGRRWRLSKLALLQEKE